MGKTEFDYYIFVDYSEDIIGYAIIEKSKMFELLPKIARFKHYRSAQNKKIYIKNIKQSIKRDELMAFFIRVKIKQLYKNMEIYLDILEFLKKHENCLVLISVDNRQYSAFKKMVRIIDGEKVVIKQESELIEGTPEYQTSLVLDNLINIERLKND